MQIETVTLAILWKPLFSAASKFMLIPTT